MSNHPRPIKVKTKSILTVAAKASKWRQSERHAARICTGALAVNDICARRRHLSRDRAASLSWHGSVTDQRRTKQIDERFDRRPQLQPFNIRCTSCMYQRVTEVMFCGFQPSLLQFSINLFTGKDVCSKAQQ